jgi:DNA-binding transcriptional MerR regulator
MGGMRARDPADLAGTTVRTIRYYHQLGLLAVPESGTTWRSYGFAHLTRLMRIRWLVDAGVPLADVPHMLRPPDGADERKLVLEDLAAVLVSIDEKIGVLTAQRGRVETLRGRVASVGRLSPLPPPLVRVYAALLDRPLSPAMAEAIRRERDLPELACYRGALPHDVVTLVDALSEEDVEQISGLWADFHCTVETSAPSVPGGTRQEVIDVVRRTVDVATRAEPQATRRLLVRATALDRPAVRAAFDLAYPSPVYRQLVRAVLSVAQERSAR